MGVQHSTLSELPNNKLLKEFVQPLPIDRDSNFWDSLLDFHCTMKVDKSDSRLLKETVENLCILLVKNNKISGNFATLTGVAIYHIREMLTNNEELNEINVPRKCRNALFIIRCCCEYFVEHCTEEELIEQFNILPTFNGQSTIFDEFLSSLSEVMAFQTVDEKTHHLHLEAVTVYLVLLCVRMFEGKITGQSKLYQNIMKGRCSANAYLVVRKLLHNYIKNEDLPLLSQGVVGWAASGFWSFFGSSGNKNHNSSSNDELNPLANHSFLLLLVLTFHYMKEKNPYREALFLCKPGNKSQPESAEIDRSFPLNFKRLYKALARDLHTDQSILLLYLLLHKNSSYLKFTLSQKDLESQLLPILEVLYSAEHHQNAHHIYMALIVLLICTQEEHFNQAIHEVTVPNVVWYKEKNIAGITLGSLLILIVLKTIQYNMAKMRDKYLHTNCLASLANMASTFKNLHPVVTQKLISLLHQLVKRHAKLTEKLKENKTNSEEELSDLAVLEEIIHMMIEILNACFTNNIEQNPGLVYALVRDKELFQNFRSNSKFQDIIQNIDTVLTYFCTRIDEKSDSLDTADGVIDIIKEVTPNWPKTEIKKFPQLKFKYMEEEAAEDFFVPYVWSIIYKSTFLYWQSEKVTLFHIQH